MEKIDSKIWIWIEKNSLFKAVYNSSTECLIIYNECDEIVIRKKQVTEEQMNKFETVFSKKGAKRIDNNKKSFIFIK